MSSYLNGYPSVYVQKPTLYDVNTPLFSNSFTYCASDVDCSQPTAAPGNSRCLGLGYNMACSSGTKKSDKKCICTNEIIAARFSKGKHNFWSM